MYKNFNEFKETVKNSTKCNDFTHSLFLVAEYFCYNDLEKVFDHIGKIHEIMGYKNGYLLDFQESLERNLIERIEEDYGKILAKMIDEII